MNDFTYAFRTFRRSWPATLTIVLTVAMGLGLVAAVFTMLNAAVFRVDAVRNPGELFAVVRPPTTGGERAPLTHADFDALRRETTVFADTAATTLHSVDGRVDGRLMGGTLVSGNFFAMLGVTASLGRTLAPTDDAPGVARPVMVISDRAWAQFFFRDPTVIGRRVNVNGARLEIVGVMPKDFRGLRVGPPDYWAPLGVLTTLRPFEAGRETNDSIEIVGRLAPGVSRAAAVAALNVWDTAAAVPGRPRDGLLLEPRDGTLPQPLDALAVFVPLFFAFGLILVIGCANVANLLLARGVARQREIGVRLAVGGSRRRIIRQLLTENLLLALAAAAVAFAISRLTLAATVAGVLAYMTPELAEGVRLEVPPADWRIGAFLVLGAIIAVVFFGLAPALQTTRLELVRTMRGDVIGGPRRTRHLLIGLQVTASALLLICAVIFLRSASAAAIADPGIRTSDIVIVELTHEPLRRPIVDALRAEPVVVAVAASSPGVIGRPRPASAATTGARAAVAYQFVSPEYFAVLDIGIVRGRGFTPAERDARTAVAVIAESVARQLWPRGDAIGQALHIDADPQATSTRAGERMLPARTFTVIGVARDVRGFGLADFTPANVYLPADEMMAGASLALRVHGDPDRAREALFTRLTSIDAGLGSITTLRTVARLQADLLRIAFGVTVVLGGLALVLTLSGLFSVLSYLVGQRTKEIGVRMALGATAWQVAALIVSHSLRPIASGLAAGTALAIGTAAALMASPVAAAIGATVRVFDPVAHAASLAAILAACLLATLLPAGRAARIDPVTTLRQD